MPWMTAADAARALGVSRATLYAYVSRGRIRSQAMPGSARARGYARDDVERLRRRTEERRAPDKAAARSLQWGLPVLESSIALIDGQRLFYRGHDAVSLARTRSLEEVASLIWTGGFTTSAAGPASPDRVPAVDPQAPFVARAQAMLALAAASDPSAVDPRPEAVVRSGWRILRMLVQAATARASRESTLEAALAQGWRLDRHAADLVRAVLVLCADHELNVSSFTARCVASAGFDALRGGHCRPCRTRGPEARRVERPGRSDADRPRPGRRTCVAPSPPGFSGASALTASAIRSIPRAIPGPRPSSAGCADAIRRRGSRASSAPSPGPPRARPASIPTSTSPWRRRRECYAYPPARRSCSLPLAGRSAGSATRSSSTPPVS